MQDGRVAFMYRLKSYFFIIILCLGLFIGTLQTVNAKDSTVILEYFYINGCHVCEGKKPLIDEIEQIYGNNITIFRLEYKENLQLVKKYGFTSFPSAVVVNLSNDYYTLLPYYRLNKEDLQDAIERHITGNYSKEITEIPGSKEDNINMNLVLLLSILIILTLLYIIWKK